jgi:hypothetical protein
MLLHFLSKLPQAAEFQYRAGAKAKAAKALVDQVK